jgi:hypothetical protein
MRSVRVEVWLLDHIGMQRTSSLDRRIEIVHLEPQQDSMSRWRQVRVDKIRVILLVPGMDLEDQLTVTKYPIINIAMLVFRECADSQQLLIPAAACAYVSHGNQRLSLNMCSSLHVLAGGE